MERSLLPGKLPPDLLAAFLADAAADLARDPRVIVGPRVGVDAAVIDFGGRYLVAKSDPITFATEAIGWYAVQVNANDLAVMGAVPRWFLATFLLPEGVTAEGARIVLDGALRACRELSVPLVGGHTEITFGLDRPIVCGQMLGEAMAEELVPGGGARPGDRLLLTKAIPLEATALLAREQRGILIERGWSAEALDEAASALYTPGISILPEARLAVRLRAATAMHDPTEGGLATGLRELALASGVGLRVLEERIPIRPDGRALCAAFDLDPLGAIASGSLLLAAPPERVPDYLAACAEAGIPCAEIGEILPADRGLTLVTPEGERPLPVFDRDELARMGS